MREWRRVIALSVVVPTWNTAEMTLRCCASVLAALPADAEVIVVDDGSTDSTSGQLRSRFPSIEVIRSDANRGFAVAANRGVEAARGAIVLLLNSDTIVAPRSLDQLLAEFAARPRLGVAGAQLLNADGSEQWSGGRTPSILWLAVMVSGVATALSRIRRKPRLSGDREVDWVSGAAMAFRREVWAPLREDFRFYAQDLDFCLKARAQGWEVRLLSDVRVQHLHGATIARDGALHDAPEKLWPDLLQWGRDYYGEAWGRRARRAMRLAAMLRLGARRLLRSDAETTARYRRAADALKRA